MSGQIVGACGQHASRRGKLSCDQGRVLHRRYPHRHIDAAVHQINQGIGQFQVHRDLRIGPGEAGQCLRQMHGAEAHGRIDPQPPARRTLQVGNGGLCGLGLLQDAGAEIEVDGSDLRQADLAGIAVDQPRSQPFLQP